MPRKRGLILNHILLNVKDVEKSGDFYIKKLGFRKTYGGEDYVSVRTPNGILLGLHVAHEKKFRPIGSEFYFKVDDVDRWYDRLRKKGVRFTQRPKDMPWGARTAYLKDPDGYLLAVHGPTKTR